MTTDAVSAPGRPLDEKAFIKPGFRHDINGLRAIAVSFVTLYHFHTGAVNGGYLGVDIFFVISGFLMTKIILGELELGRFFLSDFYAARVKRIIPPLLIMCLAVCMLAALVIDPLSGEGIGRSGLASLTFWSNMLYASQGGYFAAAQESNWLIHTWSLSVEWQFYIIYPLILMLLHRLISSRNTIIAIIGLGAVVSLALALAMSMFNETTAIWGFYLLPSRAWEMCGGGLCAYMAGGRSWPLHLRRALHVVGLAVAVGGCFLINSHFPCQPAWIALTVLGTMAVIRSDIVAPRWATPAAVRLLGRWSYSIYLWHWPVIAGLSYWGVPFSLPVVLAGIAGSVVLGALSYTLVERRLTEWLFRRRGPMLWGRLAAGFAVVVAFTAATTATHAFEAARTADYPNPVRDAMADDRAAMGDWRWPQVCSSRAKTKDKLHLCFMGDPKARDTLVIGDSHMEQIAARYAHGYAAGQGVTFVTQGGCMPVPGVGRRDAASTCAQWVTSAYRFAEHAGYRRVVIGSIWFGYFEPEPGEPIGILCFKAGGSCTTSFDQARYHALIEGAFDRLGVELVKLRRTGAEVSIIEPFPAFREADPGYLYRSEFFHRGLDPRPADRLGLEARTRFVRGLVERAASAAGASVIDPVEALCPGGRCPVVAGGRAMFKDGAHYRASSVLDARFAFLDHVIVP
jgi:peptidoglycan/LPS O-acetylase OafA/YrhL